MIPFFSRKAVNTGRQNEIDWLKGFTALDIVICHVGLYLGSQENHGLYSFADICGSEFAAPVLMVLMGIGMTYSRHQAPKELFRRGVKLFIIGYLLNFVRSILPLAVFGQIDEWTSVEAFFVVDILPFAGLTFLFLALLRKLKIPSPAIFALSVVMVIADCFLMLPETVAWDSRILTGLVNLFSPVTEWSCFPFLTWFFFPAFGLCFGELLRHCENKRRLYLILLPTGLLGVSYVYYRFYLLYPDYTSYYFGNNFYYMGVKNVFLTLLFFFFALAFWFFAGKILPGFAKRFLVFLSKNLIVFYIFTWIEISLLMHFQAMFGWQFGTWALIALMVLVIISSAVLTNTFLLAKRKIAEGKFLSRIDKNRS